VSFDTEHDLILADMLYLDMLSASGNLRSCVPVRCPSGALSGAEYNTNWPGIHAGAAQTTVSD
jgi:hypothetical protein